MADMSGLSDLLSTLPEPSASNKGILESLTSIRIRDHGRAASSQPSASRLLRDEKLRNTQAEANTPAISIAASTRPRDDAAMGPLHAAIVAGHEANMREILERRGGSAAGRQKSKRANQKAKKGKERGEGYTERRSSKSAITNKRKDRLNVFKKQY